MYYVYENKIGQAIQGNETSEFSTLQHAIDFCKQRIGFYEERGYFVDDFDNLRWLWYLQKNDAFDLGILLMILFDPRTTGFNIV